MVYGGLTMSNRMPHILVVDDEKEILEFLVLLVKKENCRVSTVDNGRKALEVIDSDVPDLILTDIRMPELDGLELLKRCGTACPDTPVVLITAYADIPGAVEAMRAGAHDYLAKPFDNDEVLRVVRRALAERALKLKIRFLSERPSREDSYLERMMGPSDAVKKLISEVTCVARSDFSVIILGETGSGKELVSQAIHRASSRVDAPFLGVDCGAIPESLFESELFGHEKGAFTDARIQKPGKFEIAHGGTLFLDEIGNMPLASQVKLLRTLQEETIYRVGGTIPHKVDVRLLVASNENLEDGVATGGFRQDLYFRLSDFTIRIPPLRERPEDIPYLATRFLHMVNKELKKNVKGISRAALEDLMSYEWPGNVRQLRSTVRRAALLADEEIHEEHLSLDSSTLARVSQPAAVTEREWQDRSLKDIVSHTTRMIEREVLTKVLIQTGGNKAKAARILNIDYKTIHTKVKKLGVSLKEG